MYIITVTPSSMFALYILVLVFNVQSYWHIKKDLFTLFLCIFIFKVCAPNFNLLSANFPCRNHVEHSWLEKQRALFHSIAAVYSIVTCKMSTKNVNNYK